MRSPIKTKWFAPYTFQNKILRPSLTISPGFNTGVYLIKMKGPGKVVYIGYSASNLYKTIYRHFQEWNDVRERIVYAKVGYLVRILFCSKTQALRLERYLINKYRPRDNANTYDQSQLMPAINARDLEKDSIYIRPGEDAPF